ncbi:MAG: hypothetical protein ACR2RL_21515 [Gammaproteobacteria bacterium]
MSEPLPEEVEGWATQRLKKLEAMYERSQEPRSNADRVESLVKGLQAQGGVGAVFGIVAFVMLAVLGWKLINDMSDALGEMAGNQRALIHQNEKLLDKVSTLEREVRDSQRMRLFGSGRYDNPYDIPNRPNRQEQRDETPR